MLFDKTRTQIGGGRKWYVIPLSILAHVVGLMFLIIATLQATGALPNVNVAMTKFMLASPPPVTPPNPEPRPRPSKPTPAPKGNPTAPTVPTEAPTDIHKEGPPTTPNPVPLGPIEVGPVGNGGPVIGTGATTPPEPTPTEKQEILPVGGLVRAPARIKYVEPVYPPIAMAAKVEGIVILQATIGEDGSVRDVKVLRSQPLLEQAAVNAVRGWKYTPPLLNGKTIAVYMTVTVNFAIR